MRSRELLVLISALALFAGIGYVALAPESEASELPPEVFAPPAETTPVQEPMAPLVAQGGPIGRHDGHPTDGDFHPSTDDGKPDEGVILGDIALVASVVNQIQSIQIHVEELRPERDVSGNLNQRFTKVVPVARGIGTPTFRVDWIPLSPYGYTVTVHSPGLNGSQQTVALTEDKRIVDDVQLTISPGVPFSVLLRDQDNVAHAMVPVRLQPTGEPLGRPVRIGSADNYGSAIFENVLRGDYLVHIGDMAAPLAEPVQVTVQPTARVYGGDTVQAQGQTIIIPRGVPMPITVTDVAGYGIQDATVQLLATDRRELKMQSLPTDGLGRVTFPNVPPGLWEVTVLKDNFQRTFRQVTVKQGATLENVQFKLVRLR
jgi:hypothetical protein